MTSSNINCDEEDEDVVIAGSELHEALSKMGYMDYDVVSLPNSELPDIANSNKSTPKIGYGLPCTINFRTFRGMMKDSKALRQQLTVISEAQHLLDDHAELIKNLLDENGVEESGRSNKFLQYLKYVVAATFGYYCIVNRSNRFSWWLTLPALTTARYKYTKWRSNRNLKELISEQTELYYTYKKTLRILNHSFRTNNSTKPLGSDFTNLGSEKLKFLQPLTEGMLRSLATMSIVYYGTTLKISQLLGANSKNLDDKITYFNDESFINCGEVTYDSLKVLDYPQQFYRFILIQSEMLLTLAVFYYNEPSRLFSKTNGEMKMDHNVEQLVKLTTEQRISMTKLVDNFNKHKLPAVGNKYRGFAGSKWQDLFVRLHLTSHKMQKAYDNIISVLEEIENHLDKGTDESELLETLRTKLDNVCSNADKARDLAQLSSLIITKMWRTCNENQQPIDDENKTAQTLQKELPVVRDADPEIIDEVFEEYIRERYSEVLLDKNGDDYLEGNYKLDKLLSKNLMSELKDALVDKQKDTKERESRALKRMNKNSPKRDPENLPSDSEIEVESSEAAKKVDLKSENQFSRVVLETVEDKVNHIPMPPPPPLPEDLDQLRKDLRKVKEEETGEDEKRNGRPGTVIPLPISGQIQMPLFLSNNEETFIGSGENSDEELLNEVEEDVTDIKL